jgi:hypothetical protein
VSSEEYTACILKASAVICLDCEDMIVVDTPDALLILPRTSSSGVRDVVELIKQRGWHDLL